MAKSVQRVSNEHSTKPIVKIITQASELEAADRIILPGVGAFADCIAGLKAIDGMVETLHEHVLIKGKPFLGVCVGMQMLASSGHEHGHHEGLGWIEGDVLPLTPSDPTLKIPHMGWNNIDVVPSHPYAADFCDKRDVYFVHSYHFVPHDPSVILATANYGQEITAMVAKDSILGTQFHPEKSHDAGLALLSHFISWRP